MAEREDFAAAAELLLCRRFVVRKEDPEGFSLVRRQAKVLADYFRERLGWQLYQNAKFFKLEKIPAAPLPAFGLPGLKEPEDYALLSCVLAFLEGFDEGGQFLLSQLLEELPALYPASAPVPLAWENYAQRRRLIRVMKLLAQEKLLVVVEDESKEFLAENFAAGEALYEVTALARYFLRALPRALSDYADAGELAAADFAAAADAPAKERSRYLRWYLLRRLLLEPACYPKSEEEISYLRNQHTRLASEFVENFDLELELYEDAALAVSRSRTSYFPELFPVASRGLHDVLLHFASLWRAGHEAPTEVTEHELLDFLEKLQKERGAGFTKEYREMTARSLYDALLPDLLDWGMAEKTADGTVRILPALYRLAGDYGTDETKQKASSAQKRRKR